MAIDLDNEMHAGWLDDSGESWSLEELPTRKECTPWLNGHCSIMAHALHQKYGLTLVAIIFQEDYPNTEANLAHAMAIAPNGKVVDSRGARDLGTVLDYYRNFERCDFGLELEDNASDILVYSKAVTIEELDQLTEPFKKFHNTEVAHEYIEKYERFFDAACGLKKKPSIKLKR